MLLDIPQKVFFHVCKFSRRCNASYGVHACRVLIAVLLAVATLSKLSANLEMLLMTRTGLGAFQPLEEILKLVSARSR